MKRIITTLEEKKALATELLRIQPKAMNGLENDFAMALLLQLDLEVVGHNCFKENVYVRYPDAKSFRHFSPTSYPADFLYLLEHAEVVVSTHTHDDETNPSKRFWYSAHSYMGNTHAEGFNLRTVACEALTRRLAHDVEFSSKWGNP